MNWAVEELKTLNLDDARLNAREPLGVLNAWIWARDPKNVDGVRDDVKESTRWIEGYERVAERAAANSASLCC